MPNAQPSKGLWTESLGEIGATLKALQDGGITREHLKRLRSDSSYRSAVIATLLKNDSRLTIKGPTALMGENFFSIEDWINLINSEFYRSVSEKDFLPVPKFPWSEELLNSPCPFYPDKKIKDTHFAFLGIDVVNIPQERGAYSRKLTIQGWKAFCVNVGRRKVRFHYNAAGYSNMWYETLPFAKNTTCTYRWYLMPIKTLPSSHDKTFAEQQELLPPDYEIPLAVEELTKHILYYLKTGKRPQEYWYLCRDVISGEDFNGAQNRMRAKWLEKSIEWANQRTNELSNWPDHIPSVHTSAQEGVSVDPESMDLSHPLKGLAVSRKLPIE